MARIIENQTLSDIILPEIGVTVPASGTYDLSYKTVQLQVGSATLITELQNDNLRLIKSTGPTVYYTADKAQRIFEGFDDAILAGGGAGELLSVTDTGTPSWTSAVGGSIACMDDGLTFNKWLSIGRTSASSTSDTVPAVIPFNSVLYSLTYINSTDDTGTDVEIYKNGVLLFTWQIRNKRRAYKTDGLTTITFLAGDYIGIYMKDVSGSTKPSDPLIYIHYSFTDGTFGEGGSSTL